MYSLCVPMPCCQNLLQYNKYTHTKGVHYVPIYLIYIYFFFVNISTLTIIIFDFE